MSVPYADEKWITVTPGAPLQGGKTIKITFRQGKLNEDLAHLHFLLQESGLREKTGKKVTEKLMKTRSIYLKDPSSTESPAIILGDGSWYDELHDTEEYTFTLQQRVVNPFINDDDRACCGLDFIHHIEKIESFFSFLDITEDEDKATEVYIEQSKYLLAGGKVPRGSNDEGDVTRMPRLLPKDSEEYKKANKETARVIPFEDEMATGQVCMRHLLLPETDDWYEVEHRNFMKTRIRIEMKDTAKYCVFLFYLSILEFCFGWVILGVGTLQLNGGSEAILIASFTCGAIMALSSVLGFLGSLSAHEAFIQRFMVSALLTMSFLTTYLYVEISFLHEKTLEFGTNDLAPATAGSVNAQHGSGAKRSEIILSLGLAAVGLAITFCSTYTCTQALDAINDLGTLQDDALVFRYFQVRFTELKHQVESFADGKSMTQTGKSPAVEPHAGVVSR